MESSEVGFLDKVIGAAKGAWQWVKSLPVIKPLFALAYSRKTMISLAVVGFMLEAFPKLANFENETTLIVSQIVVIAFVAIGQSLGIAIEDAAEKHNGASG
jgi:hypothetical protein